MFSSTILDVAVGLIFVFFVVSLAASAILEAVAGIITWRSGTLLKGVKDLLNDETFTGLAAQLYQHALINPRNSGKIAPAAGGNIQTMDGKLIQKKLRKDAPAYIDPKQFAEALIDILNTGKPGVTADAAGHPGKMVSGNPASIASAIDFVVPVGNQQINALLHGIARRAGNDLDKMKQEIASWFDNAMDRVSGVYKRWTQLWHFLIALTLAVLLNVSTLHVAASLWKQPTAASSLEHSKINETDPVATLRQLDSLALPIGWSHYKLPPKQSDQTRPVPSGTGGTTAAPSSGAATSASDGNAWDVFRSDWPCNWDWPEMLLGWLITAVAALFGAPFWFDLLQRVIRLKAAGPSPEEKASDTAAAA